MYSDEVVRCQATAPPASPASATKTVTTTTTIRFARDIRIPLSHHGREPLPTVRLSACGSLSQRPHSGPSRLTIEHRPLIVYDLRYVRQSRRKERSGDERRKTCAPLPRQGDRGAPQLSVACCAARPHPRPAVLLSQAVVERRDVGLPHRAASRHRTPRVRGRSRAHHRPPHPARLARRGLVGRVRGHRGQRLRRVRPALRRQRLQSALQRRRRVHSARPGHPPRGRPRSGSPAHPHLGERRTRAGGLDGDAAVSVRAPRCRPLAAHHAGTGRRDPHRHACRSIRRAPGRYRRSRSRQPRRAQHRPAHHARRRRHDAARRLRRRAARRRPATGRALGLSRSGRAACADGRGLRRSPRNSGRRSPPSAPRRSVPSCANGESTTPRSTDCGRPAPTPG